MNDITLDLAQVADIKNRRKEGQEISIEDIAIEARALERIGDFSSLAALPATEYDRIRNQVAKALEIRVTTLDVEVSKWQSGEDHAAARGLSFDEPDPWPDPVDGAVLLDEIATILRQFIIMPEPAYAAVALWVIHTWVHGAARVSPILAVVSPEKRCGKTTLLEVLAALSRRPLPASNITAAALFRAVEKFNPTLLIDEADTFLRNSDELRGVLNSGHRRRSACVIRTVGDDHEPKQFCTWAPKVIALIGKLPPTLADRSITVSLCRRGPEEVVERWRDESFPELRKKIRRFSDDSRTRLQDARPQLPSGLHDRALDNWEPLFAIADAVGGKWPKSARDTARKLNEEEDDESVATMLLGDIRDIYNKLQVKRISSVMLCECLVEMEERPWPEWGRAQKPITPRQVARLLKPFGIIPGTKRFEQSTAKGYDLAQFSEAFARYLPANSSVTASQTTQDAALSEPPNVTVRKLVTDRKSSKPAQGQDCDGVTHRKALRFPCIRRTRADYESAMNFWQE